MEHLPGITSRTGQCSKAKQLHFAFESLFKVPCDDSAMFFFFFPQAHALERSSTYTS